MERDWLDYASAIGSIVSPLLLVGLGGLGWKYRTLKERRAKLDDQLRDDRINTYNVILEPFTIMLMSDAAWAYDKTNKHRDKFEIGTGKLLSLDYRKAALKLTLVAEDDVVEAYDALMQFFYNQESEPESTDKMRKMLSLFGELLLQIRRSMGNEATKKDKWGMLEWFISDINNIKHGTSVS